MLFKPRTPLEGQAIIRGRNFRHPKSGPAHYPLALKSATNGEAFYETDSGMFVAEDKVYVLLNAGQPYKIHIDSPTEVETFSVSFPDWLAKDVLRGLVTSSDLLLDDPEGTRDFPIVFLDGMYRNDNYVMPYLQALRTQLQAEAPDDLWLEEKLQVVLIQMLHAHRSVLKQSESLSVVRRATRVEMLRRLRRGRDYIDACSGEALTLSCIARQAAMSPFHFLRFFKLAFGYTPYAYLTRRRIERAKWFLAQSSESITQVSLAVGFASVGALSTSFRRHVGVSPRVYRKRWADR